MHHIAVIWLLLSLTSSPKDFTLNSKITSPDAARQSLSANSHKDSVLTGNVAVRRAANGNIVIIVDRTPNITKISPDDIPDLVFRLAPLKEDLSRYGDISFNLKQARVFFQTGRLAVVAKNNQMMLSLSVEEIENTDSGFSIYGDQSKDVQNTVPLHRGIGLVRQLPIITDASRSINFGKTPKTSKLPTLIEVETDFEIRHGEAQALDDGSFEAACTAGGQGATSCSIDCPSGNGCSVTCGTGWACCKCPNNCRCAGKS